MRIECDQCSATYTIDDDQIGDQAIGAQCPYCGHVKVVQRSSNMGADLGFGGSPSRKEAHSASLDLDLGSDSQELFGSGFDFDRSSTSSRTAEELGFGYPPPPQDTSELVVQSMPLGPASGPELAPTSMDLGFEPDDLSDALEPGRGDSAYAGAIDDLDAFGLDPSELSEASTHRASMPLRGNDAYGLDEVEPDFMLNSGSTGEIGNRGGEGPELDGLQLISRSAASLPMASPGFDEPDNPIELIPRADFTLPPASIVANNLDAAVEVVCRKCGIVLTDEFDKVIGLCETHQQERRSADVNPRESGHQVLSGTWHARGPDGSHVGPLELDELRSRIRSGQISRNAQFSTDGKRFAGLSAYKELSYLANLNFGQMPVHGMYPSSARRRRSMAPIVTGAIVFAVLCGFAYVSWIRRDEIIHLYQTATAVEEQVEPRRAHPLSRYLAKWRRVHTDMSGTVEEHLRVGDEAHLRDTWTDYDHADKSYQRALLLDENSSKAIARYVENRALWYAQRLPKAEFDVARRALDYALELSPQNAAVHRALGALAWAAGDLGGCRTGADKALGRNPADARARLVLASCYIEGNPDLARSEANLVRHGHPELKRADHILSDAFLRSGRFSSAYKALEQRLKTEGRNASLHTAVGRIDASLGRWTRAESRFRRAVRLDGDRQGAWIALGQLLMEQRRAREAVVAFTKAEQVEILTGGRAVALYAEWARAELTRERINSALKLAQRALKIHANNVSALLVYGEALYQTGALDDAATALRRALSARVDDVDEPSALILAARVQSKLKNYAEAVSFTQKAVANDPKDARTHVALAAQYLAANQEPQAYVTLRKVADLDPVRGDRIDLNTPLSISHSALKETIERFRFSGRNPRNSSIAEAAIGVVYYYLGDKVAASKAIQKALKNDDVNLLALVYKAHIAFRSGAFDQTEHTANKLLLVDRGNSIGYLYRARVYAHQKNYPKARANYRAALRSQRGLVMAEVELAALDLEQGKERQAALAIIRRAYNVDPHMLDLRRLLERYE